MLIDGLDVGYIIESDGTCCFVATLPKGQVRLPSMKYTQNRGDEVLRRNKHLIARRLWLIARREGWFNKSTPG